MLQYNEKMKVQYLRSLLFDLFETLQAVAVLELGKGISLHFKFHCYGNQNQNCLLLKNERSIVKAKVISNSNLKQYSLIATAGSIKF